MTNDKKTPSSTGRGKKNTDKASSLRLSPRRGERARSRGLCGWFRYGHALRVGTTRAPVPAYGHPSTLRYGATGRTRRAGLGKRLGRKVRQALSGFVRPKIICVRRATIKSHEITSN